MECLIYARKIKHMPEIIFIKCSYRMKGRGCSLFFFGFAQAFSVFIYCSILCHRCISLHNVDVGF